MTAYDDWKTRSPDDEIDGEEPPLADRIDAIKSKTLALSLVGDDPVENNPHRPEVKVWAALDEENLGGPVVTLAFSSMWGQAQRFADLMPVEARKLARMLIDTADAIDAAVQP